MSILYYLIHGKTKREVELEYCINDLVIQIQVLSDFNANGCYPITGTNHHNIEDVVCFDCYRMSRIKNGQSSR